MTGYAKSDGKNESAAWSWEIKSVNSRNLDIRCKLPTSCDFWELEVCQAIKAKIKRGFVSVNLHISRDNKQKKYKVNKTLVRSLFEIADQLSAEFPNLNRIDFGDIVKVQGIVEPIESALDNQNLVDTKRSIFLDLGIAIDLLLEARRVEGKIIQSLLRELMHSFKVFRLKADDLASVEPEFFRKKLKNLVGGLLESHSSLNRERLENEVAILLTRADVREELDRLNAHEQTMMGVLEKGGVIGRRLDFLCQELNREANTICSKATSSELTDLGIELKVIIDQVREQAQNIE